MDTVEEEEEQQAPCLSPRSQRLDWVCAWQRWYNMEPRTDSRLTQLYVDGKLPPHVTPQEVARELMSVDFIYKHTLYGELIEAFMRAFANRLRSEYPHLTWTQTWEMTRFHGPAALKLYMLLDCKLQIPERLPC